MDASRAVFAGALAALLVSAAPPAPAADTVIHVLTGGASSAYYPLGVALGDAITKTLPGVRASVQGTRGAAENLNLLQAGGGEIGFASADVLADAWMGREEAGFRVPLRKLRGIGALYPNYIQIVARADARIRALADLRGKRVSVGAPRSAIELNARVIVRAAGLRYQDFAKTEYLPFGESIELMKGRQLDATLQSAVAGASALRDFANAVDIVVVPIPVDVIRKARDPAYIPGSIPANTYRGQGAVVPTAAILNFAVTQEDVGDDVAYAMTKALWTNLDRLAAAHPAAKAIVLGRALEGMPVPLHPGAARYYREAGVLK